MLAIRFFVLIVSVGAARPAGAEPVTVTLDPTTVRNIGGVSEFSREQYITIHESPTSGDQPDAIHDYLQHELEVSYGRSGGEQTWRMPTIPADPENPGMPDVAVMAERGAADLANRQMSPRHNAAQSREVVLCTHPQQMVGIPGNDHAQWGPTTPEAAAEFAAQFLKHYYSDDDRPRYYEVFNEPFVHAKKIGTTIEQMSWQHVVTARRIREVLPAADLMIGGYTAAWAEVEARNFEHWNNWQKKFMDIAGDEMDFFSTHLYDGINVRGAHAERTGSNTEAIIDLIDSYSYLKWGYAKPQVISEYGRIIFQKSETYETWRDAQMLKSFNGMLTTFMDHPDRLIKTVPFILGTGEWTYTYAGGTEKKPYDFLLFRRSGDGYVTTELELFYKFWKGLDGQWRYSRTDDPDVRCHLLADGQRLTVVLTNLDTQAHEVTLKGLAGLNRKVDVNGETSLDNVSKVALRTLQTHTDIPELRERTLPGLPDALTLEVGESAMLMIDTRLPVEAGKTVVETRVYATSYLKDIVAGEPIEFAYENVPTGKGSAVLRLSIGREPGLSLRPEVTVNGQAVDTPTDWAGGDQAGRPMFYGMIEVPVPVEHLTAFTTVALTFPGTGGKVACAVLQTNLLRP